MRELFPRVWVGSAPDVVPQSWEQHHHNNIRHVVSVAADLDANLERENPDKFRMSYSKLGITDGGDNPLSALVSLGLHLFSVSKQTHENILIICHGGESRSPAAAILLMSLVYGYTVSESMEFLATNKRKTNINPQLLDSLTPAIKFLNENKYLNQ